MNVRRMGRAFGVAIILSFPLWAHASSPAAHRHSAKKHRLTFDQKIALIQHRIDVSVRRAGAGPSTESIANAHHLPLSVVDDLLDHMSWGQTYVYISFAEAMAAQDKTMSPADAFDPLRSQRKAGLAWHEIATSYHLSRNDVIDNLASNSMARSASRSELARR